MTSHPIGVVIGGVYFAIDPDSDVPFRRIYDSLMQPRTDVSGVPGAVNLQRDVWLWSMSDFTGGEGREVFDSGDPVGPPTFFKTDGGIDARVRGEFSLHPDEKLYTNETGGGSSPTKSTWTNTDFTTVSGSPTYSAGGAGNHVRLSANDKVRAPARTPGSNIVRVTCRFVQARTTTSNRQVSVKFEVWNNTDSLSIQSKTKTVKENEPVELTINFTATAGKTYHYRASNEDSGSVTVDVKHIKEESFGTGPASPQDIRDLRLGIGDNVWALAYDGTSTDVLRWNFGTSTWDQIIANMNSGQPRALTGSDQYMYALLSNGRIYRINGAGAVQYTQPPTTSNVGEPLGIAVANNKVYALFDQALFSITLDSTSGSIPFAEGSADYTIVASPGEFPKENSPDTTLRQHTSATTNGVRFFVNVRGSQTVIYEYADGALTPGWMLPKGYVATAIHHYANITFIAADFTNSASTPAESRAGLFYIGSDTLLRFLGYLRFTETNSQQVSFIDSYAHDVYFLQGRRRWRYNLGSGGITLENVTSQDDESMSRAMASMDKKFWVAVEGEGTFVADDAYPTTTMWLYSPLWDYDVPDLQKILLSFDVVTRPLPSNTKIEVEYRIDEAASWTSAGTITTAGSVKTNLGVSISEPTTTKFTTLQYRIGLTSIDGLDTPRVLSVTARGYVLDYERMFDFTILLTDDTSTDRMPVEQISGRLKANRLFTLVTNKTLTTFSPRWESGLDNDQDSFVGVIEDPFSDLDQKGQGSARLKFKVLV